MEKNLSEYIKDICTRAKKAAPEMAKATAMQRNCALENAARILRAEREAVKAANDKDMSSPSVPAKMLDRLKLTDARIDGIADALEDLCRLPDPLGRGETWTRPNGLRISNVSVPLGVTAIIYEARPNVTFDAAALCIKTGNAVLLRGGKEAICTNRVLAGLLRRALAEAGMPEDGVILVDDTSREGTQLLMGMRGYIDVLVPRGGAGLIRSVVENAKVRVIETGAGNCHVYVDRYADIDKAVKIAVNAKVSRPSVCNAAENLIVHADIAEFFLPGFANAVLPYGVELRGCERTLEILPGITPATDEDFFTEYNDLILSIKIVDTLEEAISHINLHSTSHSEAIVTEDRTAADIFKRDIDSAAVYVNASTRFTDGGEFGFGAELGISTQKMHARGPMGLEALTSNKYLIEGDGQVR